MKTLQKTIYLFTILFLASCSKDSSTSTDAKTLFKGNWSGEQQIDGVANPYAFDLIIYQDDTVKNTDLAFNSEIFPGSYTYTNDSIKINYNNGTKWKLKFSNNYASATGIVLGAQGATGTVTMSKN